MRALGLLLLLALGLACGDSALRDAALVLRVDSDSIDFGAVDLDSGARRLLQVRNDSGKHVVLEPELQAPFVISPRSVSLSAGASVSFDLYFEPERLGPVEASLQLGDRVVALRGIGNDRSLQVEDRLDFDRTAPRTERLLELAIRSDSVIPLDVEIAVEGLDAAAFFLEDELLRISPGEEARLPIRFRPTERRFYGARLILDPCGGCVNPAVVNLLGEGAAAVLEANPSELDFGVVSPGRMVAREVQLANEGTLPLRIESLRFGEGTGVDSFELGIAEEELPIELASFERRVVEIRFAPAVGLQPLGLHRSALEIRGADDALLLEVPLRARSGGPDIEVRPERIDFGLQPLGARPRRTVVVANVGEEESASIRSVELAGKGEAHFRVHSSVSLPFDVGASPLAFEVEFLASVEEPVEARLVLTTDQLDESQIVVPLSGSGIAFRPCDLSVTPAAVDFGKVTPGRAADRTVELLHRGEEACHAWGFGLEGSHRFRLLGAPAELVRLEPNVPTRLQLRFQPADEGEVSGTLFFFHGDLDGRHEIPLVGRAGAEGLTLSPSLLYFAPTTVGDLAVASLRLRNDLPVATRPFRVQSSSALFSVVGGEGERPGLLPGEERELQIAFQPQTIGLATGQIEVEVEGEDFPLQAQVQGWGRSSSCGASCLPPVVSCPSPGVATVGTDHLLAGAAHAPSGGIVQCAWSIVSAPAGSAASIDSAQSCDGAVLAPDVAGRFDLRLVAVDEGGVASSCETHLDATPPTPDGLWIEATWDRPGDIDLHLLNLAMSGVPSLRSSWAGLGNCHFGNCLPNQPRLAWDRPGTADDPLLDRDDVAGQGPENVRIEEPAVSHAYAVGVKNYFNADTPVRVRVRIRCGEQVAYVGDADLHEVGDLVYVGSVLFEESGSCVFTPDGSSL